MGRCGWDGCRRGSTAGSRRARSTPSSDCMDLRDRTAMILGGSGLVGHAVARRLLAAAPRRLVLVALFEEEVRATARALDPYRGRAAIEVEWGNVFLPGSLAQLERGAVVANPDQRRLMLQDLLSELTDDVLQRSFLYQLLVKYKPDAVVDAINTATAFAYQDPVESAQELLALATAGKVDRAAVERHILLLTLPQLIRHVQILVEALRRAETRAYVKIGTSGTGGMGFNIPYTHSEERPSRPLLMKSAVAGAQSLLLFLLGRTPGAPAAIEIKPTATIAWREIGFGPIRRKGKPIPLVDCPELPQREADSAGRLPGARSRERGVSARCAPVVRSRQAAPGRLHRRRRERPLLLRRVRDRHRARSDGIHHTGGGGGIRGAGARGTADRPGRRRRPGRRDRRAHLPRGAAAGPRPGPAARAGATAQNPHRGLRDARPPTPHQAVVRVLHLRPAAVERARAG